MQLVRTSDIKTRTGCKQTVLTL